MKFPSVVAVVFSLLAPPAFAAELSQREQASVIERVAVLLEERYVYADRGKSVAAALRRDAAMNLWASESDPKKFAEAVTTRLREFTSDGHLGLEYRVEMRQATIAPAAGEDNSADLDRWYGPGVNHGFESVSRLEQGVGYLDLRVFAPVDSAGDMATSAMTLLAQSPALIIDLRKNGGGMGEMTAWIAAYLFDDVQQLSATYDRPTDKLTPLFTPSNVPGRRFGGKKPIYILTSKSTFSAAEAFAYDLQSLQRATIVGERTGGGAHPFEYRRVNRDFVLALPEGRSVNPVTGSDWEGTGVVPDVATTAESALNVALQLAHEKLELPR